MHTLKASSLLETIVAMVILLTVFSISIVVIQNVLHTASIGDKTNSYFVLQEELYKTLKEKKYFTEEIELEGYTIHKEVYDSVLSDSLMVVHLKAVDKKGIVLSGIRETVLKDE